MDKKDNVYKYVNFNTDFNGLSSEISGLESYYKTYEDEFDSKIEELKLQKEKLLLQKRLELRNINKRYTDRVIYNMLKFEPFSTVYESLKKCTENTEAMIIAKCLMMMIKGFIEDSYVRKYFNQIDIGYDPYRYSLIEENGEYKISLI